LELLRFSEVRRCTILRRVNRFTVLAELDKAGVIKLHNTNTGKLNDVLVQGRTAYCIPLRSPRRTSLRLLAVQYRGGYALVDTQTQEEAFAKAIERQALPWLASYKLEKRHVKIAFSRLDFKLRSRQNHREAYLELKSAILAAPDGAALYPDTPSPRGRRHIAELVRLAANGFPTYLVFIAAFTGASYFKPNCSVDPRIGELVKEALNAGVEIHAVGIDYDPETFAVRMYSDDMPVRLC